MPFIRVRSAGAGDPRHEFDIPAAELQLTPEFYEVVDPTPADVARDATFAVPTGDSIEAAPVEAIRAASSRPKPGEKHNETAPAGAES